MEKIYIVTSQENQKIKRDIPWSSSRLHTKAVGVKEFVYDNFIENIEDDLIIKIQKKDLSIVHEIIIEKGNYELDEVLGIIRVSLEAKDLKNIKIYFNKSNWKIYVLNDSKYIINGNKIFREFFNLPEQIDPFSKIKSKKVFDILKTKSIYIKIKNLKNAIYLDNNDMGEVIFSSTLRSKPGIQTIDYVHNSPPMYEFFNPTLNQLEISITDENNKIVNLQNIKIMFHFLVEKNKLI